MHVVHTVTTNKIDRKTLNAQRKLNAISLIFFIFFFPWMYRYIGLYVFIFHIKLMYSWLKYLSKATGESHRRNKYKSKRENISKCTLLKVCQLCFKLMAHLLKKCIRDWKTSDRMSHFSWDYLKCLFIAF